MTADYKTTVFLPKTTFSMKANLSQKEPEILDFWDKINLNQKVFENPTGKETFILHDGPPYANGDTHMGHAFNRCLKDMVMKYQRLVGKYVPFIPGWDCHGLPIEWKVEERYRKENKDKDIVPILQFRQECREYASHWVKVQINSLKRLGVLGNWDHPYLTMTPDAEAIIVSELHKFLMSGDLYRGSKPVQWSVVEKTALAEAEVEYKDKISPAIYVKFPLEDLGPSELRGASVVIWTTTPWTIPANRAVAYHPDVTYVLLEIEKDLHDDSHAFNAGERLLIAEPLVQNFAHQTGIANYRILKTVKGLELTGLFCKHPLYGRGYNFTVPLLPGDHVTTDQGTGFVHTAPSHGVDDFWLGQMHGLEVPDMISEDGHYYDHVPVFAGLHVFKANEVIMDHLRQAGRLVFQGTITHSYPHSWRSKAPLIFRTTSQWFIAMEKNDLRKKALEAIEQVKWVPVQSKNRIRAMVENRPDWCISRQRAWGVPIAVFVSKTTGLPLKDKQVNNCIADIFSKEGSDAWFSRSAEDFLGSAYSAEDFEMVKDVVDVWFESGVTFAFVLENNPALKRPENESPADLYLEGSDQHRGWFQSSLLASVGTRGHAPYKAVLTHGFIVDGEGKKMSKSVGNALTLDEIIQEYGADLLKLWVVGSDYSDDLRLSRDHFKRYQDIYRRLRNTIRYLLGNLGDNVVSPLPYEELPQLEQWVLHRLAVLDDQIRERIETYDLHSLFKEVYHFCNVDLSSFYFDIRKDVLYCDARNSLKFRAAQTVLSYVFHYLTLWLSPILSFTCEEAWQYRFEGSVHLQELPSLNPQWLNASLEKKWDLIRAVRSVVTGALEQKREQGIIGSSLQGHPTIFTTDEKIYEALKNQPLSEIFITSQFSLSFGTSSEDAFSLEEVPQVFVTIQVQEGEKCERCWQILPEVGCDSSHKALCERCVAAVEDLE